MNVRRREKRDRKVVGINIDLFVSGDRIQNIVDPKGLKLKMSSVLNVSNDSGKPQGFSIKDIEMLVDDIEQNLFKRAHVGKFLGLIHIHSSTTRLADEYQKTRASLKAEGGAMMRHPLRNTLRIMISSFRCCCKLSKRQGQGA